MKLRYIIPVFAAVLTLLTGCKSEEEQRFLNQFNVSTSYVALDKNGGSTTVTVNATESWAFDTSTIPDWLTVSPASGSAGSSSITFSADAYTGRTAQLKVNCGSYTQEINVIQGIMEITNATCAEVLAGPDAKTYRVTGAVTGIANTTYGNWYMNDGTGEVYIYGTLDSKGAEKNFSSLGIEVGDEVTVEGPKTTYNGTVELVNVTVVKISKSLIKVDSLSTEDPLPIEGGEVTAFVSCKGDGINVEIPEDAKSWLGMSAITSNSVTFVAQPNLGGDRKTTVTLKTYNGGKEYTCQFDIFQAGAIIDATVAEFLAAEVGDTQYRLQGVITNLYENDKQGKSFYVKDFSGETLVYRAEGFLDSGIKVGDVVELVGKRGAYKDNPQMVEGTCTLVNAVTPVTIAEFFTMPDDKATYYMVTGTISSLKDSKGNDNDYGNMYITDGTTELYVYGCYAGWGAQGDDRKFFVADNGLKEGDEITIIGYKDTYKELVELCQGVCFSFKKAE